MRGVIVKTKLPLKSKCFIHKIHDEKIGDIWLVLKPLQAKQSEQTKPFFRYNNAPYGYLIEGEAYYFDSQKAADKMRKETNKEFASVAFVLDKQVK